MEYFLIAIVAGFNLVIVYWKIEHRRFTDATLDVSVLVILATMFGHSTGGMIIATISSAMLSLVLLIKKPTLPILLDDVKTQDFIKEFKSRMPR